LLATVALVLVVSCGSEDGDSGIPVAQGETRLSALLRQHGVVLGRTGAAHPLRAAWRAFQKFARVPVQRSELANGPLSDGLLFEFGVSEASEQWGKTFHLSFVRQLATADGDLQQVHLAAHFEPTTFEKIRRRLSATRCADPDRCLTRCSFDEMTLVGTPCAVSLRTRLLRASAEEPLVAAHAWSFDADGSDTAAQRDRWMTFVENSPVFRIAAREFQPRGYELWQESAE
jgi:hypothetical protein